MVMNSEIIAIRILYLRYNKIMAEIWLYQIVLGHTGIIMGIQRGSNGRIEES